MLDSATVCLLDLGVRKAGEGDVPDGTVTFSISLFPAATISCRQKITQFLGFGPDQIWWIDQKSTTENKQVYQDLAKILYVPPMHHASVWRLEMEWKETHKHPPYLWEKFLIGSLYLGVLRYEQTLHGPTIILSADYITTNGRKMLPVLREAFCITKKERHGISATLLSTPNSGWVSDCVLFVELFSPLCAERVGATQK